MLISLVIGIKDDDTQIYKMTYINCTSGQIQTILSSIQASSDFCDMENVHVIRTK